VPMTDAILLVGGRGTRLRPLTEHTAKPLLPVAGVPFVVHQLLALREAGIRHVVLATSYRAETFTEALGDGSALGLELEYVTESVPLGTGGALRNVVGRLRGRPEDPVVVLNGDILTGNDLRAQLARHAAGDAEATLHLSEVEDARAFGCVPTDGDARVTAFLEKMPEPVSNQVNAGCYVLRRRVIEAIPVGRPVSVERETFPGLLEGGATVLGHLDTGYWLDLGTPAAYVRGSCDLVLGRVGSAALPGPVGEALVLPGAEVAGDAKLFGGTTIGAGAVVCAGATVEGSVLLDGAVVGEGAQLRGSVLGRRSRVGAGTVLDGAVVGDDADVGADNELLTDVRIFSGTQLRDRSVRFSSDQA
jgi:mannose-1-phosphate guanylyltransferase